MAEFINHHRHLDDAGRAECALCCLEAERDRLRAVVDAATSDETVERAARVYAEHLSHRAGIRACIRAALESALDGSEDMGGG